jgi:hypothetical protein
MFDKLGSLAPNASPPTALPPLPILGARSSLYGWREWDIERVKQARRLLDGGDFAEAVALRSFIRLDPRARGVEGQLADTFVGLGIVMEAGDSDHGNSAGEAMRRGAKHLFGEAGTCAGPGLLGQLIEDLAGFAYAPCFAPSGDGSRWEPVLTPWPLEAVVADPEHPGRYLAITAGNTRIPIEGQSWIEFKTKITAPHQRGAVRAIGETWISRAYALGDWNIASSSNSPKRLGELPDTVALDSEEAKRFASDQAGLDRGYSGMVFRHGAKVTQLKTGELSHKIHMDLASLGASDYAIAYLGQDGTSSLGTTGTKGAREVLYDISYDVIRGLARAVSAGLCEVSNRWAYWNHGREQGPKVKVNVPDLEAEQARSEAIKMRPLLIAELDALARKGPLTRPLIASVADAHGVQVSEEWMALWTAPAATVAPEPTVNP